MTGSGDKRPSAASRWLPWIAVAFLAVGSVLWFSMFMLGQSVGGLIGLVWASMVVPMVYLLVRVAFPFLMAGRTSEPDPAHVLAVRMSGPALWSGSPGGRVGQVSMSSAMLVAAVHPGGIVVTPRLMTARSIPANEIASVTFGKRLTTQTIEVNHAGTDVGSPLVLYGSPTSPQALAIGAMLEQARLGAGASAPGAPRPPLPGAWSAVPARPQSPRPPLVMTAMSLIGLLAGVLLVGYGFLVAIPQGGVFGLLWTGFGVAILAVNTIRFIRRGW